MKVIAAIQARMGSTRFPGKVMAGRNCNIMVILRKNIGGQYNE